MLSLVAFSFLKGKKNSSSRKRRGERGGRGRKEEMSTCMLQIAPLTPVKQRWLWVWSSEERLIFQLHLD